MKDTRAALHWVTDILKEYGFEFFISGGLAANLYGANRPLADIDIGIDNFAYTKLQGVFKEYIVFESEEYIDETWRLPLITLNYSGQEIDLFDNNDTWIFNKETRSWQKFQVSMQSLTTLTYEGISIPVVSRDELIAGKVLADREVDITDLNALL